jgi:hypothetical protein
MVSYSFSKIYAVFNPFSCFASMLRIRLLKTMITVKIKMIAATIINKNKTFFFFTINQYCILMH